MIVIVIMRDMLSAKQMFITLFLVCNIFFFLYFVLAIVVYDSGRDLTWRLSHPAMFPDPNFAQSNILGHRFTLMDGIVGITFDATLGIVYFQPLATDR